MGTVTIGEGGLAFCVKTRYTTAEPRELVKEGSVMRTVLGAGWYLYHLTDRSIELRKDDWAYRKLVGRDGYVRIRAEPGMDRNDLINKAVEMAKRNDAAVAKTLGTQVILRNVRGHQARQRLMATLAFGTPEDPEIIGVKKA
jgi:hypothetical protein